MDRTDLYEHVERQIAGEKVYRARIKKAIALFEQKLSHNRKKQLIAEKIYRAKVRHDLKRLLEKKDTVKYASTGLNTLDDLFMNTNLLDTLETPYNSLTTSAEQRNDYKNHVLQAILDLFKTANPDTEEELVSESLQRLFEEETPDISISVTDEELPDDKVVGPEAREAAEAAEDEKESPESDNAEAIDEEGDFTGRNKAQNAVAKVEKSILDYYQELGNPADKSDFKTYLLANLRLYFSKWENALRNDVNPQFSDDVNKAVEDAEADVAAGEVQTDEAPVEPATDEAASENDMSDLGM